MPYSRNQELPKSVRDALPASAQSIYRNAWNSAERQHGTDDESRLARIAWGAVKNAGWEKNEGSGEWHKVEKQLHQGVWLGFPLPSALAELLAQHGGELSETLHITVAYWPDAEALGERGLGAIVGAVTGLALTTPPVAIQLGGVASFAASDSSDGKDVVVALIDSAELEILRGKVRRVADVLGMPFSPSHGYTPHIALRFHDPASTENLPQLPRTESLLVDLELRMGETVIAHIQTTGPLAQQTGASSGSAMTWVHGDGVAETLLWSVPIAKAEDAQRRVFGWGSVAVTKEGETLVDLQGDVIDITDLEEAIYGYVQESRELNFDHAGAVRGTLIESMVFTSEKLAALGIPVGTVPFGAWMGFEIDTDENYALVKGSGLVMFSIEGTARREEVTV